jgi:hypothetical protein
LKNRVNTLICCARLPVNPGRGLTGWKRTDEPLIREILIKTLAANLLPI